jgi:LmbE family N-acetylglucosaminyl deacetylase
MPEPLDLLFVLAHPDDESLGAGGVLAKYSAEGVETFLVTATRGERGWRGPKEENPGAEAVGKIREAETRAAAEVLGLREVCFLDYLDGEVAQADFLEATRRIVQHLRRIRPRVVVTFSPDGHTGHPDHIAVSQLTCAAVLCAADATYADARPPHRVSKLYYMVDSKSMAERLRQNMGDIGMTVDGVRRPHVGWEEWAITTRVDASDYWQIAWQAIQCHASQFHTVSKLRDLPEAFHREVWGNGTFYRVLSLVNGGRNLERDLFEGLKG